MILSKLGWIGYVMHDKAISDIFMPPQTALHFHATLYWRKWVNTNILYVLHGGKLF